MIHSMTAFARQELKADFGNASWEIRSVNQRFLETYFRLPETFRSLEPALRERLRKRLNRGKVECALRFEAAIADDVQLDLNKALAEQLIDNANWVLEQTGHGSLNPMDVLRWPGVIQSQEQDSSSQQKALLQAFDQALESFLESRAAEGQALKALIEQRLDGISELVATVRAQMPEIMQWQRERLISRLEEAKADLDPARLEQEMIMLAQKQDVAEELDRLDTHVQEAKKILKKGGACGRRLDFMMQEFNREANTLASKSINADITQASVELKVLIEQMREQIQNIE